MNDESKKPKIRLLFVDDDETFLAMIGEGFRLRGLHVSCARNAAEALELIEDNRYDVALLDLHLPDADGLELLQRIKERHPDVEAIMLTAHGSVESAIQAMKLGAYDYLPKPFHLNDLEVRIQKAYEKVRLTRREQQWVEHVRFESPRYRMVGKSQAHQRIMQLIEKVAPTDATILIRGPSGAGKELVARALHDKSPRRNRPLVSINCASLQETLIESELFGHEKGSFTGAISSKPGLLEIAEGGTLFIDEIAEMAPGLQAKLLRVLENGRYRRVGGVQEFIADVRVVAATNKDLEEEQRAGRFREDLYYRLNVVTIRLIPLRERREDIPLLVQHFLETRKIGAVPFAITSDALAALSDYDWPGNIRELANVLERAQILAREQTITIDDLPESMVELHASSDVSPCENSKHLREVERRHILEMLRAQKGNKVHAARTLGISRRALYRLIAKHRLEIKDV